MAHFAKLNSENIVIAVYLGKDTDTEQKISEKTGEIYKKTSYTGSIRKNYAGIGYTYDASKDAFIPPKPYNSWVLDNDTCQWKAPVDLPDETNFYIWDEDNLKWK